MPNEKIYTHPEPRRPSGDALYIPFMLAALVLAETQRPLVWAVAICLAALAYQSWRRELRNFRIAQLEWMIANSQGWLKYYQRDQNQEGIMNWTKQVRRLEDKLEFLASHRWRVEAPDSAEEKFEKQKQEGIERAQKERVKAFRVGDRVRFKETAVDGRQIGAVTSVAKDGSSFQVKWDLYKEPVLMSYGDVEDIDLVR